MNEFFEVDIKGYKTKLPLIKISDKLTIAFFNLHGDSKLTEHCGKELAKYIGDSEVLITAESKGLQLTHVIARESGLNDYAVARKEKKLYMNDGIYIEYGSSITTGKPQQFHLSSHDVNLIKGKKVCIIDDVISTSTSLCGLEKLVEKAGGIIHKKMFVLAEGDSKDRKDITYLATIPLFFN